MAINEIKINVSVEIEQLKEAALKIYFWQHSYMNNFHDKLFDLMQKADQENFLRLSQGFPFEAVAYLQWYGSPSSKDFFIKYGIIKGE